ncbi:MAG: TetR family transcriptional regulator [Cyanobacteria bacterium P01_D01_bin.1]
MAERKLSSREKIVKASLRLFAQQGTSATTTKEIAESAGVNEVTLFRQFGSKQGLLLAVLQEASVLSEMQAALSEIVGANDPLTAYGSATLELLEQVPELMRSLIGESGQSPIENRQALGQVLRQANLQTVGYLRSAQVDCPGLSADAIATLLNTLIIGHAVLSASSGGLWQNQSDFLTMLNDLFSIKKQQNDTHSADSASATSSELIRLEPADTVIDLPAETVRSLFQSAKKQDQQTYALVYVLFGAGLTVEEAANLTSPCVFTSKNQHLLTITGPTTRQVPVNRWIMGNRYGTYLKNPLSQWIKTQSDSQANGSATVFVSSEGKPLGVEGLIALWESIAAGTVTITGKPATPFQARQTWCIELLMKGMSLENLSILSGMSLTALEPYARRAKEKTALEQALAIDQKKS